MTTIHYPTLTEDENILIEGLLTGSIVLEQEVLAEICSHAAANSMNSVDCPPPYCFDPVKAAYWKGARYDAQTYVLELSDPASMARN